MISLSLTASVEVLYPLVPLRLLGGGGGVQDKHDQWYFMGVYTFQFRVFDVSPPCKQLLSERRDGNLWNTTGQIVE